MDEDLKLIEDFQRGGRDAFDRLVEKYRARIFGLALRLVDNEEDADEIAQQTFINALTHLGQFRGGAAFRTWLYRIAINTAKNHLRSRRPVGPLDDALLRDDGNLSPEKAAVVRDEVRRVLSHLRELSEKQKLAVLLRGVHEMDYREVGRVMGCSAGTAKVHYHYGLENLRKKVAGK